MTNKFKIILLIFFQLIFFKNTISKEDSLIIQSTTSTRDSGFYDFILSKYKDSFSKDNKRASFFS